VKALTAPTFGMMPRDDAVTAETRDITLAVAAISRTNNSLEAFSADTAASNNIIAILNQMPIYGNLNLAKKRLN
jgi:hypothetical protein